MSDAKVHVGWSGIKFLGANNSTLQRPWQMSPFQGWRNADRDLCQSFEMFAEVATDSNITKATWETALHKKSSEEFSVEFADVLRANFYLSGKACLKYRTKGMFISRSPVNIQSAGRISWS